MIRGFKGMVLVAGLAMAGLTPASAQNAAAPATDAAAPAGPQAAGDGAPTSTNIAPTSVDAPAPAAPASPLLAQDGAPPMDARQSLAGTPRIGAPTNGMIRIQPQVTENGVRAHKFHDRILFPLITVVCLLVLGLLVYVIVRYRRSANPTPSRTSHNTLVEVIWTLGPVLILVAIAVPSIGLLSAQFKPAPAGAVTLKAIGNQWYWSYQYPDHGGIEITANMLKEQSQVGAGERARTDADGPRLLATDNRVVLPVGVPIRLITTANDVIHSWAMPAFWIKLDAVPGRLNETSFTITRPGLYFGQCSELCGARHAYMPIAVEAVPPAQFAAWVRAKGGTMPAAGANGAAKPSSAVIPQPGADNSAMQQDEGETANGAAANVENVTITPTTSPQGATRNAAGTGNVDQ